MLAIPPLYVGDCRSETHNLSKFNSSRALDRRQPLGPAKGMSLLEALSSSFYPDHRPLRIVVPNLINLAQQYAFERVIVNELIGNLESAKLSPPSTTPPSPWQFEPVDGQLSDHLYIKLGRPSCRAESMRHFRLMVRINSSHPDYTLNNHRTTFTSRGGATPGTLVISNLAGNTQKIVISSFGKIRVGS